MHFLHKFSVDDTTTDGAANEAGSKSSFNADIFDRLASLKKDEELMSVAQDFVSRLLVKAQEEAVKRSSQQGSSGQHRHSNSKVINASTRSFDAF